MCLTWHVGLQLCFSTARAGLAPAGLKKKLQPDQVSSSDIFMHGARVCAGATARCRRCILQKSILHRPSDFDVQPRDPHVSALLLSTLCARQRVKRLLQCANTRVPG